MFLLLLAVSPIIGFLIYSIHCRFKDFLWYNKALAKILHIQVRKNSEGKYYIRKGWLWVAVMSRSAFWWYDRDMCYYTEDFQHICKIYDEYILNIELSSEEILFYREEE